jgi:hypothetical protein
VKIRVKIVMKERGVCPGGRRSLAGKGPLDRSFQAPLSVGKSLMSEPERTVQEGKSAKVKIAPAATGGAREREESNNEEVAVSITALERERDRDSR